MRLPLSSQRADLYRYSQYELFNRTLRPAKGATLTRFNPWDIYENSQKRKWDQPPYMSLVNLANELRLELRSSDRRVDPRQAVNLISDESCRRILEWTNRFGLLGLIFEQRRRAELVCGAGADIVSNRESYQSKSTADHSCQDLLDPAVMDKQPTDETDRRGSQVFIGFRMDNDHDVLDLQLLESRRLGDQDPLPVTTFRYPSLLFPYDHASSAPYCESLEDWYTEAESFYNHINLLGILTHKMSRLLGGLKQNLSNVRRIVFHRDTGLHDFVSSQPYRPTLLSEFAVMASKDFANGHRMIECPACGMQAMVSGYQTKHCSPKCASRVRKRRQRQVMQERNRSTKP
jgi:hypothetical protein